MDLAIHSTITASPVDLEKSTDYFSALQLVVTIVTGIPGSHQEGVCSSLLAEEHEGTRWVVLNQPFHNTSDFSAKSEELAETSVSSCRGKNIYVHVLTLHVMNAVLNALCKNSYRDLPNS